MRDYVARTREFSRNANLYVLHVMGMDMIHGSWTVLFNLYLLAIGFDIRFIGTRLVIEYVARALTAIPAGLVSDRIGRKASFILGDGMGAIFGLAMISTRSEFALLALPALGAFFGNLHHTAEPAFMAENSRPQERVHLFAVAGSLRTSSAMIGALLAGLIPALFIVPITSFTIAPALMRSSPPSVVTSSRFSGTSVIESGCNARAISCISGVMAISRFIAV